MACPVESIPQREVKLEHVTREIINYKFINC